MNVVDEAGNAGASTDPDRRGGERERGVLIRYTLHTHTNPPPLDLLHVL